MRPSRIKMIVSRPTETVREALERMDAASGMGFPAGIVLICDDDDRLIAVATDGDVRRGLLRGVQLEDPVEMVMQKDPITFSASTPYSEIIEQIPAAIKSAQRYRTGVIEKVILVDEGNRPADVLRFYDLWEQQFAGHRHIVVIGLGFVGLTLAVAMAEVGYAVTGVETNEQVLASLQEGNPHFHEVGLASALSEYSGKTLGFSPELPDHGDVFVITVGTPILEGSHEPDLTHLRAAAKAVSSKLKSRTLVVIRSTVPVGVTRNEVLAILEDGSGLEGGKDFHLAFAPERTVEGDALRELRQLPQVIGGLTANCLDLASAVFSKISPVIVRVSTLEEAELVKIANNGFRDVSFAFANQVATMCSHFEIDPHSLIRAANQGYERNPLPNPSPGVGGVCLKKDPYILDYVARSCGIERSLSALGREINESMPPRVVDWIDQALKEQGKALAGATILLAGMAFKGRPETSDMRGSTGVEILRLLEKSGCTIRVHDPTVPVSNLMLLGHPVMNSLLEGCDGADVFAVLTNHLAYTKLELGPLLDALAKPAVVFDGWGLIDSELINDTSGIRYQRLGSTV